MKKYYFRFCHERIRFGEWRGNVFWLQVKRVDYINPAECPRSEDGLHLERAVRSSYA